MLWRYVTSMEEERMEVNVISLSKDKLVVYHRDEKFLRELKELLERYGIDVDIIFSSLCG